MLSITATNAYQALNSQTHTSSSITPDDKVNTVSSTPDNQDSVNISTEGKAKSQAEVWQDLRDKYDPRNMSFNELHQALTEMHDAGLIETRHFLNMQFRLPSERTPEGIAENLDLINIWQQRYEFTKQQKGPGAEERANTLKEQIEILKKL